MSKSALLISLLVLVGVLSASFVWWNLNRVSFENDPNAFMIKTQVPIYQALPSTRLTDYDGVLAHFRTARVINTQDGRLAGENGRYELAKTRRIEELGEPVYADSVSEQQLSALLTQAGELVYFRLFQDDPDVYVQSRRDRGAVAPSEQRLEEIGWGPLDPLIGYYLERDRQAGDSAETIVTESFTWWKDKSSIRGVRGFADAPDGLVCALGLVDSSRDVSVDLYSTMLGLEGWSGSAPKPSGVFLFPEKTIVELIETYGALPYATLGTVVNYEDSDPQAIVFIFLWNPEVQDWHFVSALFVNRKNQDARYLPHF